MDDFPEFETYAEVIDAYEKDNMGYATLTDYIKGENIKIKEIDISPLSDLKNMRDGGPVGIEVLFTEKVPAAPSQLVSESDIILGYRGDAAYRSASEQSKSIGQGNVGSKASFGGGKGVDRRGRDEGAGGADRSKITQEQTRNQLRNQLGIKDPNLIQKTFNKYNSLPFEVRAGINTVIPAEFMKLFNIGNVINTGINQLKNPDVIFEDVTLGMGDQPLPGSNLRTEVTDIDLKRAKEPMTKMMDYDTYKSVNPSSKITPYEFEELKKGNIKETGTFTAADGGRVGLFMGGPALEGQALSIYNSMNAYGFTDQEIANALQERGLYTPPGSDPGTPPPDQGTTGGETQRDDGREITGFGKFGNLDPTTEKTFVKDVFTIDKNMYPGAPMTGSFKPTEVIGYKNVTTGNYQTLEGKNINHGGIPIKPAFAALLEGIGLGGVDETELTGLPYPEGYIAGTFTGKKPIDFFTNQQKFFKTQKDTIADINAQLAEEAKQKALQAKIEAEIDRGKSLSQIGQENFTGEGMAFQAGRTDQGGGVTKGKVQKSSSVPGGYYGSPRKDGGLMFARGGLATMFKKKR